MGEIKKIINGTIDDQSTSYATTHPKANFAEIGVYFQSLNKKLVYEEPKYTVRFSFELRRRCRVYTSSPCIVIILYSNTFLLQLTGSMIAALGGSMSLYLGISISMLFEVFELLIDIFIAIFMFCAGN